MQENLDRLSLFVVKGIGYFGRSRTAPFVPERWKFEEGSVDDGYFAL